MDHKQLAGLTGQASEYGRVGIDEKEFDKVLDTYLLGNGLDADVFHAMSTRQKDIIQTVRKSLRRIRKKVIEQHG